MKCLVVVAHPVSGSLCRHLADKVVTQLQAQGHEVAVEDLYAQGFAPALQAQERQSYYQSAYAGELVQGEIDRLLGTQALVLCFPTWWFGFPAILKGWFDRVWGPGVAYDHADDNGLIKPRLTRLRRVLVVTTLGSPWWVDKLVVRQPVKRILKTAILGTCAPNCQLDMLSLYKSEALAAGQVDQFASKVCKALKAW